MHPLILHNDDVSAIESAAVSPGQVGLLNGWGVFSTVRVIDGTLFAFERHWERMQRDARRLRVPFPAEREWLQSRLLKLVDANHALNATLRVVVVRNHGGPYEARDIRREFDVIAFTTDLTDWPASVSLGLKPHARHAQSEFAGAKMLSWSFNLIWNEEAHLDGFDEVILLNERGEVSECTSANIFALYGNRCVTPPLASGCLPGITRELLIEEIRIPRFSVETQTIMPSDLEKADGIFITSTTRDLLPVRHIERLEIRSQAHPAVEALREALCQYRSQYVARTRRPVAVS